MTNMKKLLLSCVVLFAFCWLSSVVLYVYMFVPNYGMAAFNNRYNATWIAIELQVSDTAQINFSQLTSRQDPPRFVPLEVCLNGHRAQGYTCVWPLGYWTL